MTEGLGVLLIVGGLAVIVGLLARGSPRGRGLPEAWHRPETRDALSQMFDVLMARAGYDPDRRGACDRQSEAIQVVAMEKLRAEIDVPSAEIQGARLPSNATAQPQPAAQLAQGGRAEGRH